jgi:hypothetical protein
MNNKKFVQAGVLLRATKNVKGLPTQGATSTLIMAFTDFAGVVLAADERLNHLHMSWLRLVACE